MIKINFVGTSHGLPEKNRQCSSTFITVGGNTYIIDAGADLNHNLINYDIPLETVKAVFITHAHSDHFDGIINFSNNILWYSPYFVCKPEFYFPDAVCTKLVKTWLETIPGGSKGKTDALNHNVYSEGVIFDDGILKVTALRTFHIENSFAFLLEAEGKKIFYSGDMKYGLPEYLDLLGDNHYDLVICEGAHHDPGTINDKLLKTPTDKLYINHVYPRNEAELNKLQPTNFEYKITVDGDFLEL